VVSVKVTVPEVAVGVYVEVILVSFENDPEGAVQVAEVAPPPNEPAKVAVPPSQTAWSTFAFTVATGLTTTVVEAVAVHPLIVMVRVYVPAAAAVAGSVGF
jgi:hypothetical protein